MDSPYLSSLRLFALTSYSRDDPGSALPDDNRGVLKSPSARPRVWTVFAAYTLALAIAYLAVPLVLVVAAALAAPSSESREHADRLIASAFGPGHIYWLIGSELTFGLVAILAGLLSPVPWRSRLALRSPEMSCREFLAVIAGAVGISLMLAAALGLLEVRTPMTVGSGGSLAGFGRDHILVALAATALLPGVAEELFCRGYVQTRLCERWGPGVGILWTSFLFGLCHMSLWHGAAAAAFGLYVGYVTLWTRSILPAIAAHVVYNAVVTGLAIAEIPLPAAAVFLAGFLVLLVSVCCLPKESGGPSAHSTHSGPNVQPTDGARQGEGADIG
ncbi:MAG: lysostaphin resistance A-like protein [Thermoguttaceae bacterium]|jgi:membrane protease YdiL (CAAX protease family)